MIKSFNQYIEILKDVKTYKRTTLELIDKYVKKYLNEPDYKCSVDFYFFRDNEFIINYLSKSGDSDHLILNINKKEYTDLVKFIDDPELYMNANKYNL